MKTMYISQKMANLLRESVLMDALPVDVMAGVKDTPYCNPMFMGHDGMGSKFVEHAVSSQFERSKKILKNMGQIDSVDAKTVEDAFQKIVVKCQTIESKNKDALEKLAANYVIDLFSVPDDTVQIEARLVSEVEGGDKISPVEPTDGDIEVDSLDDLYGLDGEVVKRHFINALNMGAGMMISENVRGYLEELYDVDSRLPQLYKEALALNNYMLFKSPELGITDRTRNQIGLVNVEYGSPDKLVTISAQGTIFPVLLCELIRGFMELFSAHGLPKGREEMDYVIKKSDYLKAEPWEMRIGPYMWEIFTSYFENSDTGDMPYIYKVLSALKPDTFFKVFSEMMAKTVKGKFYAQKIESTAKKEKDYAGFTDKMTTHQTKKNVITDEYMYSEEF